MIIAQAPAPDHRWETSDFIICAGYEVNLLPKAAGNKAEQHATSSLNNTEQQAGCLMVNDKREATRIDNHNNKNNTSEASFDTRVQTNNSGIAGGKATDQEKRMKNNKKRNNKKKKQKNPRQGGDDDKEQGRCEERRDTNSRHLLRATESQLIHGIFLPRVIEVLGGTHKPIDGECPQIIQEAFPELTVEGANMQEVNQALVEAGVTVIDTFLVKKDGTVSPFACTTDHGCRVNRLLLLEDTNAFGHHVMLLPWEVSRYELEQLA